MKLQCIALPRKGTNCLVITLGAGKSVKFAAGEIVDLTDKKLRFEDPEHIGHILLGKYPKCLKMVKEVKEVKRAVVTENKALQQAPRNK